MPYLPKRRNNILTFKKDYTYSELIINGVDIRKINAIVISVDDLSYSLEPLIHICNGCPNIQLKFKDFISVMFVDSFLHNMISNKAFLMDDALRIDRGYIDLTRLNNIRLIVPLNYLMWGVKFNNRIDTYCFLVYNSIHGYMNPVSINGNVELSYENFLKIRKKIEYLSKISTSDDKEKVALVSDYIQSCTQYVEGYRSLTSFGIYITPDFPSSDIYRNYSGLIETVLNYNNGICMGIANLSTLLLNNDVMNVEAESVYGSSHAWNKVLIDGKYYYFDNTWSITRNENLSDEGLIALSFTKKYLFFGQESARNMGHHKPHSSFIYKGIISDDDLPFEDYESRFKYNKHPIYTSIKK